MKFCARILEQICIVMMPNRVQRTIYLNNGGLKKNLRKPLIYPLRLLLRAKRGNPVFDIEVP